MKCSFCDTDGHPVLRVVLVPSSKKVSYSPTADSKLTPGYGRACDACLEMIEEVSHG